MADICGTGFDNFFNGAVLPMVAYATIITGILIAISFMVGRAIANAKVTLWAKTEAVQIFISLALVLILIMIMDTFCVINMNDVAAMFNQDPLHYEYVNVYDTAENYLVDAADYSHNAITMVRYHLEGYTIISYLNAFICDFSTGSIGWGCLFGYSGANQQPLGGYGARIAALNIFFNSAIMSHFSALNFLFILIFIYKGFVFLFLPLGVFLRSMPYMRAFGSLLITVAISFLVVYPFMLAVFALMGDVLFEVPSDYYKFSSERIFPDEEGSGSAGQSAAAAFIGESAVTETYFTYGESPANAIAFAANAFVAAVFLPTIALLAAIASVTYLTRLTGEEIDLSRITRMV